MALVGTTPKPVREAVNPGAVEVAAAEQRLNRASFMELDRHYSRDRVAFEFHGAQHFGPTGRFSAAEVAQQQTRDLVKLAICVTRGIHLIVLQPKDLSLRAMQRHIPPPLKKHDLTGHELLAAYLDEVGRRYRLAARRARENEQQATPPE